MGQGETPGSATPGAGRRSRQDVGATVVITEVAEAPGTGHSYGHWVMECFAETLWPSKYLWRRYWQSTGTERA